MTVPSLLLLLPSLLLSLLLLFFIIINSSIVIIIIIIILLLLLLLFLSLSLLYHYYYYYYYYYHYYYYYYDDYYYYYYYYHYYFHDVPFSWLCRVYVIQLSSGCCPTFIGNLCTNFHNSGYVNNTCLGWHGFSVARYVSTKLHLSTYRNQQHFWWFQK